MFLITIFYNNCGQPGFETQKINQVSSTSRLAASIPDGDNALWNPRSSGAFNSNCLSSNQGLCIFYKNPLVAANLTDGRTSFSSLYNTQLSPNTFQTFRVSLNLADPNTLKNSTFNVGLGSETISNGSAGLSFSQRSYAWNQSRPISVAQDTNFTVVQGSAFFWLDLLRTEWNRRIGGNSMSDSFYSSNKNTLVYASVTQFSNPSSIRNLLVDNAFYQSSGNFIVLGYKSDAIGNSAYPMALSGEISIHEMGHANLFHSRGNTAVEIIDGNSELYKDNYFCKTQNGCFDAINEGQADFHAWLIFSDMPTGNETGKNTLHPTTGTWQFRDQSSQFNQTKTISELYRASTLTFTDQSTKAGEIHFMGGAFTSILWKIYSDPRTNRRVFEKTFARLLPFLSSNHVFQDVKRILLEIDRNNYGGVNSAIISDSFAAKGI